MSVSNKNTNYPPIVDSSIPAFIKNGLTNFSINFRVPLVVNYDLVQYIAIRIVQQENNQSIYKQYDNIIYLPKPTNSDKNGNFTINYKDLEDKGYIDYLNWTEDRYYKIQVAFGYNEESLSYSTVESFYDWKTYQNLSEWSNVIITKLISKPEIKILNNFDSRKYTSDIIQTISHNVELNLQPVFEASYYNKAEEPLYQYKFDLYNNDSKLIESSGWKIFDNTLQNITSLTYIFSHKFKTLLQENENYRLFLSVLTKNNYLETIKEPYQFHVVETKLNENLASENFKLWGKDNQKNDYPKTDENASLEIYLKTPGSISGKYYLLRTSEDSNFNIWEDLAKFEFFDSNEHSEAEIGYEIKKYLLYEDFTIESGIKYKYALQKANQSETRRTAMLIAEKLDESALLEKGFVFQEESEFVSNFQYTYLYYNGIQLRLDLDSKIQSFKRTRLAQKQDGLNSKYPIVIRNGMTDYAEFQLAGKISLHSDEYNSFFHQKEDGYYYQDKIKIQKDKYFYDPFNKSNDGLLDQSFTTFDTNPSDNNIFMERIYRTQVEKFLNNNGYKLFKSPTEGNYIITLFNVSTTPNQQLNRMIADFSSTAYEVAENTLENLKEYGINPLNVITNNMRLTKTGVNNIFKYSVGQVRGAFDGVYRKALKIDENEYLDLLNNGFKPYNYFYKYNENYISNENIDANIINYLSIEKNHKLNHVNNTFFNNYEDNIISWIKRQEEQQINEEQKWKIKNIISLTFEIYPKYNIEQEIYNLQSLLVNENKMSYLERLQTYLQIAKYNLVLKAYNDNQNYPISLIMDGKDIEFIPGRSYHLENVKIENLYLKYTRPILINYIVEKEVVDSDSKELYREISSRQVINIGQLYGIFTNEDSDIIIHHDKLNSYDIVNYKIYPSLNITKSIKQYLKNRIYLNYGTELKRPVKELRDEIEKLLNKNTLINIPYEEQVSKLMELINQYRAYSDYEKSFENDEWDIWESPEQNIIEYSLTGLDSISLEVDKNVSLKINDFGESRNVIVGPTNVYHIDLSQKKPSNNKTFDFDLIFNQPSFGLVDYQADVLIRVFKKNQS